MAVNPVSFGPGISFSTTLTVSNRIPASSLRLPGRIQRLFAGPAAGGNDQQGDGGGGRAGPGGRGVTGLPREDVAGVGAEDEAAESAADGEADAAHDLVDAHRTGGLGRGGRGQD